MNFWIGMSDAQTISVYVFIFLDNFGLNFSTNNVKQSQLAETGQPKEAPRGFLTTMFNSSAPRQ